MIMTSPEIPPTPNILKAKNLITNICPSLDSFNVMGIAGIGSFWLPYGIHQPRDIDLVVYVKNDSIFMHEDSPKLTDPLTKTFGLRTEIHILTPYSPSIRHDLEHFRSLLQGAIVIWGNFPEWIKLTI
jgi:hypothetical protein